MPGRTAQEALKAVLRQTDEPVDKARDKESGNGRGTRMTRSATLTDYEDEASCRRP